MRIAPRDWLFLFAGLVLAGAVAIAYVAVWRSQAQMIQRLTANPDLIASDPQLLAAARTALQTDALKSEAAARVEILRSRGRRLLHVAYTPTLGNRQADPVLVEFTDYTCAPCKLSAPAVRSFAIKNGHVRVAVMELPIVGGPVAEYMARFAIAAYKQKPASFAAIHTALMDWRKPVSEESLSALAVSQGLNSRDVIEAMNGPEVSHYLEEVRAMAVDLNISGVPAFVMGREIKLGGTTEEQLNAMAAAQH